MTQRQGIRAVRVHPGGSLPPGGSCRSDEPRSSREHGGPAWGWRASPIETGGSGPRQRSCTLTGSPKGGEVPHGTTVFIVCTAYGDSVASPDGTVTTALWDFIRPSGPVSVGGYVADTWVFTGTNDPTMPRATECECIQPAPRDSTSRPCRQLIDPAAPAISASPRRRRCVHRSRRYSASSRQVLRARNAPGCSRSCRGLRAP
jgi:hypothetical protein